MTVHNAIPGCGSIAVCHTTRGLGRPRSVGVEGPAAGGAAAMTPKAKRTGDPFANGPTRDRSASVVVHRIGQGWPPKLSHHAPAGGSAKTRSASASGDVFPGSKRCDPSPRRSSGVAEALAPGARPRWSYAQPSAMGRSSSAPPTPRASADHQTPTPRLSRRAVRSAQARETAPPWARSMSTSHSSKIQTGDRRNRNATLAMTFQRAWNSPSRSRVQGSFEGGMSCSGPLAMDQIIDT